MALNPNDSEIPSKAFSKVFLRSHLNSPAPLSPVSLSLLPHVSLLPLARAPCISGSSFLPKEREAAGVGAMESWREVTGHISVKGLCKSLAATSPRRSADCRPVTSLCLSLVLGTGAGGEDQLCN